MGQIQSVLRTALPELQDTELVVASDVHNPLRGPHGAPAVFGPQKRANAEDIAFHDESLGHVIKMAEAGLTEAESFAAYEGAGSAGGIGYACLLLGAKQVSGADYFLDLLDFNTPKDSCDVVITGEGSIRTNPGRKTARRCCATVRHPPHHRRRRPLPASQRAMVRNVPHPGIHTGRLHRSELLQESRGSQPPCSDRSAKKSEQSSCS
ncbi:glycerate kinase [Arthrobacter sp. OV608]|uniref:glycerate kinase n=1 Tax=Arthrobacter sp. OV608 TaxID=1882768 RepID=UPI002570DDEA|nr:glycerate kinase [Arthrobacter sp. OV608]